MKYSEIKDMTVQELRKKLGQLKMDYFDNKMKHSLGQINNPLVIRYTRKDIAKVKTAITSKLTSKKS